MTTVQSKHPPPLLFSNTPLVVGIKRKSKNSINKMFKVLLILYSSALLFYRYSGVCVLPEFFCVLVEAITNEVT